jgi:tetrahydromethanopterin S-methyltransferase subunit B
MQYRDCKRFDVRSYFLFSCALLQKEKNDIFSKAKELDNYCNLIEKQLESTSTELQKIQNERGVMASQVVLLSKFFLFVLISLVE